MHSSEKKEWMEKVESNWMKAKKNPIEENKR